MDRKRGPRRAASRRALTTSGRSRPSSVTSSSTPSGPAAATAPTRPASSACSGPISCGSYGSSRSRSRLPSAGGRTIPTAGRQPYSPFFFLVPFFRFAQYAFIRFEAAARAAALTRLRPRFLPGARPRLVVGPPSRMLCNAAICRSMRSRSPCNSAMARLRCVVAVIVDEVSFRWRDAVGLPIVSKARQSLDRTASFRYWNIISLRACRGKPHPRGAPPRPAADLSPAAHPGLAGRGRAGKALAAHKLQRSNRTVTPFS